MTLCIRCLMPDTRPDTLFEGGVCSACLAFDRRAGIDWDARREMLERLLESKRRPGAEYDCVVPSSGGKDSHYQVITLKNMGANPLVLTMTTCHLTSIGRRNIDNLARIADTVEITPNRDVRAKLNRLALDLVGDISWPEHVLIHTAPHPFAARMGIPLVFYGENPLNQYGGPSIERQAELQMTRQWVAEFGGFLGVRAADLAGMEGLTERDLQPYAPLADEEALAATSVYFLGQFIPWDSRRNADVAIEHGFEAELPFAGNWWAFENLDNAQTGIHDWFMAGKYGYTRGQAQLSVDVRAGLLSRAAAEKALDVMRRPPEEPPRLYAGVSLDRALDRIGMTEAELVEKWRQFSC